MEETQTMTTQLPLKTDYQAVRAQLESAIQQNLQEAEPYRGPLPDPYKSLTHNLCIVS